MSSHPTDFKGSVIDALREAIERQIPISRAEVNGGGGHFTIEVTSPAFAGRSMLERQRLVTDISVKIFCADTDYLNTHRLTIHLLPT